MWVWSLGCEDPLEEGMAIQSSILAWRIAWTEKTGVLRSIELQIVGHDWDDLAHTCRQSNIKVWQCCDLFGDSREEFVFFFLASTRFLNSLAHGPTSIQSLLPFLHFPFPLCFCSHTTNLCDWILWHFDTLGALVKG